MDRIIARHLPTTTDLNQRLRGHLRHPALRRSVESHQHIAGSIAMQAADCANRALKNVDLEQLIKHNRMAVYAAAVAEYASWLAGEPATADLAAVLDLEDRF